MIAWIAIIVIAIVLVIGWLAYEMVMAPMMPDDYTNEPNTKPVKKGSKSSK
jgi:flagellar basal body-associated protein FliL